MSPEWAGTTTGLRLLWLVAHLAFATIGLGVFATLGRLADRRERRRSALRDALTAGCMAPALQGAELRQSLWSRQAVVSTTAPAALVWRDLMQVARRLPAATRLVVQSAGGGRMTTRFTVETGDPATPGA